LDERLIVWRGTWVLTPIVGIAGKHLESFQEFPIRQLGLSAQFGKTLEGIQSQILKIKPNN
jgi:arylsulfatase